MENSISIAERFQVKRASIVFREAARKFEVSLAYIYYIANNDRMPNRGVGVQIKKWLNDKLENKEE